MEFGSTTDVLKADCICAQHRKGHIIQGKIKIEEVPGCQMEDQDAFVALFEPVDVRTIHVDAVYTYILMALLYFNCVYV